MQARILQESVTSADSAARKAIRLLDPNTVNQIAAGEVVERPASVLKELLENALDAGADRIVVQLEESGSAMVAVHDNGSGMSLEDCRMSLERHATSKIRNLDDLSEVRTLGFRGEAVPSIASVSKMSIATAVQEGARSILRVEGGEVVAESMEPGPQGTSVVVEDLFFNTPARLKFLKSASTELGACVETATRYALAYPEVSFSISHGKQVVFHTPGSGALVDALAAVWSREIAQALIEVESNIAGIRISGFVSPPHLTRPTRSMQLVFVNGRPVRSRTLTAALDQAYRMLTPEKRYPIAILCMDIDAERIDINVSPTKSEIKFQQEGAAFDAIRYAVKEALLGSGMIPTAEDIATVNDALAGSGQSAMAIAGGSWSASAVSGWLKHDEAVPPPPLDAESPLSSAPLPAEAAAFVPVSNSRYPFGDLLDGLKVMGQMRNTFIVIENRRGLAIIDQHVAHERVLYEYLCGLKGPTAIEIQPLLAPETLHLDKRAAALMRERLDAVREVGFEIEPFGGESFVVRAAPAALRGKDPLRVLRDLIDELTDATVARKLVPTRESIWIMSSCKMAIKAGDPLSLAEMEKLIEDLAQTENPYLCPHGRPITVRLGIDELLRKFGRA